ncbi:diadenylate cyclase [Fodinibius sp.]|uniref:diadenylate cyclase n=1 Tax=Fodinibius sp. TaxID=1872440 RepID=UPI003568C73C
MIEPDFILLQNIQDTFNTFLQNIRIVDLLDIIIISSFLYIVLNWLRQSASRRNLFSFLVILIVYVIARFTGMYLTELLIEGLFVIILIGIIVVFQSDMRRIIDRISNWRFFDISQPDSTDISSSIITEAVAKMADQRTGALIVLKGREDWDRHVHGGIELDGKITIPLLRSLFNTSAPGHDGAVLSDGQRILKFGVHLPLSTNLYKLSRGGTRHTAALGLSEKCDALVIVVSEERGTISIAQNGRIRQLESHSDLKKHLDDFWAEYYQSNTTSYKQWGESRSLKTALAAGSLAFILWLSFAYSSETVYRTYAVPIEYSNLESTPYALQDTVPLEARLTLSGSEQAFRTFEPSDLVISFDLASEEVEDLELDIDSDNINLPAGLQFFEASPPALQLKKQFFVPADVPVKVPVTGTIAEHLQFQSVVPSPETITVLVDTASASIDSVLTEPVDLSQIEEQTVQQKMLQLQGDSFRLPEQTSPNISVTVNVRKIQS